MDVRRILHPTDFSLSAGHALAEAVSLALGHSATLYVFHALLLHSEEGEVEARQLEAMAAEARSVAERLQAGGGDALRVETTSTRSVSAFDAIMGEIERSSPDIVVLGTHGRSGLATFLMGSDAEKVLRHAPCHVMSVRPDAKQTPPGGPKRLLVPIDFSDPARHALAAARSLARETGAALTLLHVVEPIPPMYYAGGISSWLQLDAELERRVSERLAEWAGGGATTRMAEGSTPSAIVSTAREIGADLIVMGTRGLTGFEHVLVGSVTERVCRFATVPVLVVK